MKRTWKNMQESECSSDEELWSDVNESELLLCAKEAELEINKKSFTCDICGKVLKTKASWIRHKKLHQSTLFMCDECDCRFSRKDNLIYHKRKKHTTTPSSVDKTNTFCDHCRKTFSTHSNLQKHLKRKHIELFKHTDHKHSAREANDSFQFGGQQPDLSRTGRALVATTAADNENKNQAEQIDQPNEQSLTDRSKVSNTNRPEVSNANISDASQETSNMEEETALGRGVYNRLIYPKKGERYDLLGFLASAKSTIKEILEQRALETAGIKWNVSVQVELERDMGDGTVITSSPYFRSKTYILLSEDSLEAHSLHEAMQKIFASMEAYIREGSGWYVKKVLKLVVHTIIYKPLAGSSFVALPKSLAYCQGILNIQNQDEKCFMYCVLASMHSISQKAFEVEHYLPYQKELNMKGIQYPVTLTQIEKFERQNANISINVFGYENKEIIPMRITSRPHRQHHVNLLLLTSGVQTHYCLITDLNRFLSRTKTHRSKMYFCSYCLHGFRKETSLEDHVPYCSIHGAQKIELPIEGHDNQLEFTDFMKMLKVPFVIYADFETLNVKLPTCIPNSEESNTTHNKIRGLRIWI